jgi:succinyl-diaminopimelate desuccinylase
LSGTLIVEGKQGHAAYPDRAHNPLPDIAALVSALNADPLDQGTDHFPPSNLEFLSIDTGNPAWNVIPAQARARFNIRHNDYRTQDSLRALIEGRVEKLSGNHTTARVEWEPSNADAFLTQPGPFTDLVVAAIEEVTRRRPKLDTGGGTSDARFITHYCPVLEFGLVGQTMHQIDERTPVADIEALTKIYRGVLDRYFK